MRNGGDPYTGVEFSIENRVGEPLDQALPYALGVVEGKRLGILLNM
jgi:hypothetical protein